MRCHILFYEVLQTPFILIGSILLLDIVSDIISKLKNPEECATLEKNALERGDPGLAIQARKQGIAMRAQAHGATTDAERACLEAVYAYERVLSEQRRRTTRASRTWQMIKRHGIIGAAERAVNRTTETTGYRALVEMGLEEYAFEAVILRYPQVFSAEAIKRSRQRLIENTNA
ncbi:MAG: hypothetical protein ABIH24_06290 [Verrucomicrobiota bacterium]